jgi:nitroimidazol reductase NimA-like FMN-containing flavoprotein (pyridoxamine 5'-phosphate oxidase superfamily)
METLDRHEIDDFLERELVGRIGCHADGVTYVVPIIYAYDGVAFHAHTIEGTKLRMMRTNPRVCFEVDRYEDGGWTSVIAQGTFEQLDRDEAERALALLAARFEGNGRRARSAERGTGRASVSFRIRIGEISGRRVRRRADG